MAITAPHYKIFKSLAPILPRGGSVLQIGEANWYGDVDPKCLLSGMLHTICPPEASEHNRLEFRIMDAIKQKDLFELARCFYERILAPSSITSIDMHGSEDAQRHDLNSPVPLTEQYDLVINHGTAEHIFNIAQVFQTMHDRCIDGGLMIHESPFTGWVDHGFYSLHPTLFYDLAAANNYEIVLMALEVVSPCTVIRLENRDHVSQLHTAGKLPNEAMLFVVYRKLGDREFRLPMQGYYARTLSPAGNRAWEERI